MDEWKPIETAPKHGTRIRVLRGDLQDTVEWFLPLNDWLVERDPDGVHHVIAFMVTNTLDVSDLTLTSILEGF